MHNHFSTLFIKNVFLVTGLCLSGFAHANPNNGIDKFQEQATLVSGLHYCSINCAGVGLHNSRIYDVIVNNFSLPVQSSKNAQHRINQQYNWYKKNPEYMQRVWRRASPYLFYIKDELQKRDLPLELALLPVVESAFDPFAYSHGRAAGLWQIIPGTGRQLGVKQNWWYDGRRDVLDSTDAALDYLESLNKQFKGDWMLAIAAYNSGPGNVRKGIRRNTRKNRSTDFWSLQLPRETKAYVPKLLALKKLFLETSTRALLPPIPDQAHFAVVNTDSQIDMAMAATLAGIDLNILYQLNPGFNHWATAPKGPHRLLVPVGSASLFNAELAQLPDDQRIKLQRYKVRSGDSIGVLAERNKTSARAIRAANNLRGNTIRAGHYLLIPQASTQLSSYTKTQDARLGHLQNTPRSGEKLKYKVKSGDSFWTIGQQFGVRDRHIAKWNGMAPRDTLHIGQTLVIWVKDKSVVNHASSLTARPQMTRKINYKVRRGDTLSGIAQKFKVSTPQLRAWNKTRLKKYLRPGQTLTLMVDVRQQSAP